MISISPEAVHAWAQTIAAIGSTVAVGFLVWDRIRPKPLEVSGYVTLGYWALYREASVYLFSETGERMIVTSIQPSIHFEIALLSGQTPAERARNPIPPNWSSGAIKIRAVAERGHTGDAPMITVLVRERAKGSFLNRLTRWAVMRPALVAKGVLPYRQKGKFRQVVVLP